MALTQAEKNELKKELLNAIKAESQSVDELTQVTSLDGISTLPAIRGTEVVTAPVALLRKPAEDAARTANAAASAANTAASQANTARDSAEKAASNANSAAQTAQDAAGAASDAVAKAEAVVGEHEATAVAGRDGATARFSRIVTFNVTTENTSQITSGGEVVYLAAKKVFAYLLQGKYYVSWSDMQLYNETISKVRKNKLYLCGDTLYVWSDEKGDLIEASGKGSGSGFFNLTQEQPLTTGYYTKDTAVAALANAEIDDEQKRGMIITFESAPGKWEDYRFIGTTLATFLTPSAWETFGAKDVVKQITVNGERKTPDSDGNVNITVDRVETDSSLDPDSDRPIQNGVVAAKVAELESGTLFGSEVEENDDNTVTVKLNSKSGTITEFTIPAGGGGGGGDDSSATKIVLSASLDKTTVKEGGNARLMWSYDHQYSGGDDKGQTTGQKATVTITAKRGTTTTYTETKQDVTAGAYTLDLTKYLLLGTNEIYVTAETTDPNTGKAQRKQAYVSVKVVTLSLSSSYNISNGLQQGGFDTKDTVEIPYAVNGTGTKSVILYVDGKQRNLHSVTRSGTTNGTFSLDMAGLAVGRHTVQLVAEMEQEGLTLRSESIYMDIFKRGSGTPFIGVKITHPDGRISAEATHLSPVIEAGQYERCEFEYVAYDPSVVPASVEIRQNGHPVQTVSAPRTTQRYANRFTVKGQQTLELRVGPASYLSLIPS